MNIFLNVVINVKLGKDGYGSHDSGEWVDLEPAKSKVRVGVFGLYTKLCHIL